MTTTYQPNYAVAPGETFAELLAYEGYSYLSFASMSGVSKETAKGIIVGTTRIDESIAEKLAEYLGHQKSFWLDLQKNYDETVQRLSALPQKETQAVEMSATVTVESAMKFYEENAEGKWNKYYVADYLVPALNKLMSGEVCRIEQLKSCGETPIWDTTNNKYAGKFIEHVTGIKLTGVSDLDKEILQNFLNSRLDKKEVTVIVYTKDNEPHCEVYSDELKASEMLEQYQKDQSYSEVKSFTRKVQ